MDLHPPLFPHSLQNMTQRSEVETWANNEVVPSFNMTTAKKYGPAYNGTQASWSNTSLAYGAHTFGVYRRVNVTLKRTSPPVPSAVNASDPLAPSYPLNFYAPVLYISPLEDPQQGDNWPAILFDLNSEAERRAAIARVLAQGACSTTGIIYLVQDTVRVPPLFRAAGLTFCPVQAGGAVNGFVTAVFNWDKMLENAVPTFLSGLVVVLEAPDAQGAAVSHSFVVRGRSVADLGKGAQFDPKFSEWRAEGGAVWGPAVLLSPPADPFNVPFALAVAHISFPLPPPSQIQAHVHHGARPSVHHELLPLGRAEQRLL